MRDRSNSVSKAVSSAIVLPRRLRHAVAIGMVLGRVGLLSSPWWMDGMWLLKNVSAHWQVQVHVRAQEPKAFARWAAWACLCLPWCAGLAGLTGAWRLLRQFQQGRLLDLWLDEDHRGFA